MKRTTFIFAVLLLLIFSHHAHAGWLGGIPQAQGDSLERYYPPQPAKDPIPGGYVSIHMGGLLMSPGTVYVYVPVTKTNATELSMLNLGVIPNPDIISQIDLTWGLMTSDSVQTFHASDSAPFFTENPVAYSYPRKVFQFTNASLSATGNYSFPDSPITVSQIFTLMTYFPDVPPEEGSYYALKVVAHPLPDSIPEPASALSLLPLTLIRKRHAA